MTNTEKIIDVQHLTSKYDTTTILEDISFSVSAGEIFMIVGPSGCGKSTLLNHLIGLLTPVKGRVVLFGQNIQNTQGQARINLLKKIGVAFQSGALFGSMSLLENTSLPLEELTDFPQEKIKEIALNKLTLVNLAKYADYFPSELSGGMQKRAAIARAMALDPKLILLDEPSAGLDPITSAEIDKLIFSLSKKFRITFFIVSHELHSIDRIADRVIILKNKKIAGEGTPKMLRQSKDNYIKLFFNQNLIITEQDNMA